MHQTFFYFQLSLNVLMKRLTASPKAGNYPPSSNDPDKGFGGSDDKDLSKTPLLGSNDSLVGEKYNMVTIFFYNTPKKKKKKTAQTIKRDTWRRCSRRPGRAGNARFKATAGGSIVVIKEKKNKKQKYFVLA